MADADQEPAQPADAGAQPPDPAAPPAEPVQSPEPAAPYLPLAAYPVPNVSAPPPPPTWTKAYEIPTARSVVSAGIQLAVESTAAIRRASIYIGLLALGAFGPAVLLVLLAVGKLLGDPATAASLESDPTYLFIEQPHLVGPLVLIYALAVIGLVLLVAISIDAEAMALAILGGRASDQPLRLWEAVLRARQVFWRLFGAGLLSGVGSTVVTLVVTAPFIRPFDSNTGITFIGSLIGALVVTPFIFASAGIVLGDVGAIEALRRSVTLFRARPRIALVVTLFTLVTAAIQTFAFGAGADVAVRVGELLHLGLDQGGLPVLATTAIVLAFIVAFGSLTFTIAAIVAAPQVTGFLGLTYYSAGLDRARTADGVRPSGFRWVSVPMAVAMVGLGVAAALGLPTINDFEPRPPSATFSFLRSAADEQGVLVDVFGSSSVIEDAPTDDGLPGGGISDIVSGEVGYLFEVPDWLLEGAFDCDAPGVTCDSRGSKASAFSGGGAILFAQRMAQPPGEGAGAGTSVGGAWGPAFRVPGARFAPSPAGDRFPGASHAYVTSGGTSSTIKRFERFTEGKFLEVATDARSIWVGDALITMIPFDEIKDEPLTWDMLACATSATVGLDACDFLRGSAREAMIRFEGAPDYLFFAGFEDPFSP